MHVLKYDLLVHVLKFSMCFDVFESGGVMDPGVMDWLLQLDLRF